MPRMMPRYCALLGRQVDIYYWSGQLLTPATGILAADSGKSIFIEEQLDDLLCPYRWEISYRSIVSVIPSDAPQAAPFVA